MIAAAGRPILAIDTAFDACSAALVDPRTGELRASHSETIGRGHAERLPATVDAVLAAGGLAFRDIGAIAVTVGPGSFTGVRVGVAAARGYALTLGVPAFGLVTLAVVAEAVRADRPVLAVHDAKRGDVYALVMSADGEILREAETIPAQRLEDALDGLSGPIDVAGSGALLARDRIGPDRCTVRCEKSRIDVPVLARLVARPKLHCAVKPLYLRVADAKPPRRTFSLFDENA